MMTCTFHLPLLITLFVSLTVTKSIEGFLLGDLFGGNDFMLFSRLRCLLALRRTGLNFSDFDRYPSFFRDDSIVEFAQAGVYQGASNIEEYARFIYVGVSPYYTCCNDDIEEKIEFVGYENGQCEFLRFALRTEDTNPNTTAPPSEAFQWISGGKIYLDFKERYIKRINVLFSDDLMRLNFDVFLNSDNTRKYVCSVVNGVCADTLNTSENASSTLTCEEQLLTLPSTEGEKYYIDGKSQGCRVLHAQFAANNPVDHCAHLSYTPLEDPKSNIKCQNSKGVLPSSLFTENELQLFKDFASSVGIDPELGHNYVG